MFDALTNEEIKTLQNLSIPLGQVTVPHRGLLRGSLGIKEVAHIVSRENPQESLGLFANTDIPLGEGGKDKVGYLSYRIVGDRCDLCARLVFERASMAAKKAFELAKHEYVVSHRLKDSGCTLVCLAMTEEDVRRSRRPALYYELADTDLEGRLKRPPPISPEEADSINTSLKKALEYFGEHNFFHRDMKPGNVFLFGTGSGLSAKVADFGNSVFAKDLGDKILAKSTSLRHDDVESTFSIVRRVYEKIQLTPKQRQSIIDDFFHVAAHPTIREQVKPMPLSRAAKRKAAETLSASTSKRQRA